MENGRVGTLRLSGNDATNFAHSFFCPSVEEIVEQGNRRAKRNKNISLRRTDSGFSAEVDDLDLSFLEEGKLEQISVTVTVLVKTQRKFFDCSNISLPKIFAPIFISATKKEYTSCETSETTQIAA